MKHKLFLLTLLLFLSVGMSYAQLSVSCRNLIADYRLKGKVKHVSEAHWDNQGHFLSRQDNLFSRTGKVLEEIVYFSESDDDIASMHLYNYASDGSVAGFYHYTRSGENYAVIENFSHWIAFYDKQNRLLRKTTFNFQPITDRYGKPIWYRNREDVFTPRDGHNDTLYTFNKKTGRTISMRYDINELETKGQGSATYSYGANGDTLSIVYDDPTGQMPNRTDFEYKYVNPNKPQQADSASDGKGRAVSPILQQRMREAAKKKKRQSTPDTLHLTEKIVTTRFHDGRIVVRSERYDDSSKLVWKNITITDTLGNKHITEWRYNQKWQLTEMEESNYVDNEVVYQVKDRFTYDRNGDPTSRTRSGKSVARPATWKFLYRDYDDKKNWTHRTYIGPAEETEETVISPKGNKTKKITYSGESRETDTRIIKYY